ncbi:hypothetical protein HDZ31DRAFT_67110 [Schizophyllum fasciatum]
MDSEVLAEPPPVQPTEAPVCDTEPAQRLLSYKEYHGTRHPTKNLGEPGDIYICSRPSNYALYARLHDDWAQWPGPHSARSISHPEHEGFRLGVNMKTKHIGWLESDGAANDSWLHAQFPHDALYHVLDGPGVHYLPHFITGDKRRKARVTPNPSFKRPKLLSAVWTAPDQEDASSLLEGSDSDDDFYWTDQEDEEKMKKVPERPLYPPEDLVLIPRCSFTGITVTSATFDGKTLPSYADDITVLPSPPTPPPSPPPPESPRLVATPATAKKNAVKEPRSRARAKTTAAKRGAKRAGAQPPLSGSVAARHQNAEPGPSRIPSRIDSDGESERSDTPDPPPFEDYDSLSEDEDAEGSDDSGERQGFFTRADITFQPINSRFPTPSTPLDEQDTHQVVLIHPPFTKYPGCNSHSQPLAYSLLVEHPDWVLDARDFVWNGNPNPNAVPYPASLEPPRGRLCKESRLRCTFCNRSYAGVNAKSMWRRHVFDYHGIAMTNRRDGVGKSTSNPPANAPRDPRTGLKIQSAPGSSFVIPPPSRTHRLPPRSLAENVPAHLPGTFDPALMDSAAPKHAPAPPVESQSQSESQPPLQPSSQPQSQPQSQIQSQSQSQSRSQSPRAESSSAGAKEASHPNPYMNNRHLLQPDPPFPPGPTPPTAFGPLSISPEIQAMLLSKFKYNAALGANNLKRAELYRSQISGSQPAPGETSTSTLATFDANGEVQRMAAEAMQKAAEAERQRQVATAPPTSQSSPLHTPSPTALFAHSSLPRNFPPPPSSAPPSHSNSFSNGITNSASTFGHGLSPMPSFNVTGLPMDTSFLPPNFQTRFPSMPPRSIVQRPERRDSDARPGMQRDADSDACQCFIPTQSCGLCRMRRLTVTNGAGRI